MIPGGIDWELRNKWTGSTADADVSFDERTSHHTRTKVPHHNLDQWELTELTRRNRNRSGEDIMLRLPDSAYEATARHMWRYAE